MQAGLDSIESHLEEGVERETVTPGERKTALARIEGSTDLDEAVGDATLVAEAVPEDSDLKKQVFGDVEVAASDDAGIATNTPILRVTELDERFKPPQILERTVRAGKLGRKTGEGSYEYEDGERVDVSDWSVYVSGDIPSAWNAS